MNLLYGHGNFSPEAVSATTLCLWAYGMGLLPSAAVMLFSAVFYAEGNFRAPTRIAVLSIASNLLLNLLFVFVLHWGAVSIALSTSAGAWLNGALLAWMLHQKGWTLGSQGILALNVLLASVCACLGVLVIPLSGAEQIVEAWLLPLSPQVLHGLVRQLVAFLLQSSTFLASFLAILSLIDKRRAPSSER